MTNTHNPAEFRATAGNAGFIGASAFIGALIGFVLQLLVAYYFGAGESTDAFFMAQSTSEMLSKLLLGGSITAVFIPLFVERLVANKRDDAWHMALNMLHLLAGIYVLFIVLLAFFARPFTHFIAPGFSGPAFELTVSLLRILLPSFFFLFLVEFSTSMLQALKVFTLPALLRLVAPTISIVTVILFAPRIGIVALAAGVVIGSIVQFLILAAGLKKQGFRYHFVFQPGDPMVRRLLHLVYPFVFAVLATQGAGIVYRILVSDLTAGSLASLKFAEKISSLLAVMFVSSVTAVIFPTLSEKASRRDLAGMRQTVSAAIRLIVFVTVPLVVGVALLREPLITTMYQRGSFSAEDAAMTSIALLFLIIGLTTNGISSVLGHTVLALKQTRVAVAVTVATQIVAIALFTILVPRMGHAGLALASSLVPIGGTILYGWALRGSLSRLPQVFWHATYAKIACLAILLGFIVWWSRSMLLPYSPLVQLAGSTLMGSAAFFGGAYLWHIDEAREAVGIIQRRFFPRSV